MVVCSWNADLNTQTHTDTHTFSIVHTDNVSRSPVLTVRTFVSSAFFCSRVWEPQHSDDCPSEKKTHTWFHYNYRENKQYECCLGIISLRLSGFCIEGHLGYRWFILDEKAFLLAVNDKYWSVNKSYSTSFLAHNTNKHEVYIMTKLSYISTICIALNSFTKVP